MEILLDENKLILAYAVIGELDDNAQHYSGVIPENFYEDFKPNFYMLVDDVIVKNPDYVAPEPLVIGPSKQDKINAQMMLNQAKQKENQDKFNAQILLKLAGGMK